MRRDSTTSIGDIRQWPGGVIRAVEAMNLRLVPESESFSSPTVTAFYVPNGLSDVKVIETARGYGAFIAGSWGPLRGKVLRIGHMAIPHP